MSSALNTILKANKNEEKDFFRKLKIMRKSKQNKGKHPTKEIEVIPKFKVKQKTKVKKNKRN
jgi:hypothetical protein